MKKLTLNSPSLRGSGGVILIALFLIISSEAHSQSVAVIIREGTKRAIKAIDLKVQRLQNKTIGLQNAQKALENKLSELKLTDIGNWARKARDLFKKFYDEFWKVRKAVADYQRIRFIIQRQQQIVQEYKFHWHMARQDKRLTADELQYMSRVYSGILSESAQNLDQLLLIIKSYALKISDAKRLQMINETGEKVEQNYADLKAFNNQGVQLSMSRAKDLHEIESVRKLYGIK